MGEKRGGENRMRQNPYLFAAYAATWIIHITYLTTIVRRYSRLQREINDLKK
jgi:CcmD family protein